MPVTGMNSDSNPVSLVLSTSLASSAESNGDFSMMSVAGTGQQGTGGDGSAIGTMLNVVWPARHGNRVVGSVTFFFVEFFRLGFGPHHSHRAGRSEWRWMFVCDLSVSALTTP